MIVGNKIVLRPIESKDTLNIVKWRNNPKVRERFIFRETFTVEMHEKWLNTKVKTGEVIQYIIEEKSTRRPIGSVYFRDVDRKNESAEFGIFIGEDDCKGKGYGSEAVALFTQFGLNELKFHRISLRVFEDNEVAYRIYLKAGFEIEGVFKDMVKLDGEFKNIVFMAIVKKEN